MFKKRSLSVVISLIILLTVTIAPVKAQYPFIQDILVYSRMMRHIQDSSLEYACIRLDGRCLFKLAATEVELFHQINSRCGLIGSKLSNSTRRINQNCTETLEQLHIIT